jgi:methionyl-tRNA synthetase
MINKYFDGIVPVGTWSLDWNDEIFHNFVEKREINNYCGEVLRRTIELNKYIEHNTPWNKDLNDETRGNILHNCCLGIYKLAQYLYPITPDFSGKILLSLACKGFDENIVGKKVVHQGILITKVGTEV